MNIKYIFTVYFLFSRYAIPLFIRIQQEMDLTSTFKQIKPHLVKQGFDPEKITDMVYYLDQSKGSYVPLNIEMHKNIIGGQSKL